MSDWEPKDFFDRLLPKITITETCWLWTGTKAGGNQYRRSNQALYGQTRIKGQKCYVHRVIYEMFFGPIPDGYVVDHTCSDLRDDGRCMPHCVNPSHLKAVPAHINNRRAAGLTNCGDRYAYDEEDWTL